MLLQPETARAVKRQTRASQAQDVFHNIVHTLFVGVQNQQVKRPTPPPGVNRAAPPALARRTNMPFQAGPAGQQAQGPAGMPMGVQPAGVMGAHQPRPAQARPYYPTTVRTSCQQQAHSC